MHLPGIILEIYLTDIMNSRENNFYILFIRFIDKDDKNKSLILSLKLIIVYVSDCFTYIFKYETVNV